MAYDRGVPLVAGISVVYLYVSDLDRSLAFYRDLLGIPLERDPRDEHWAEVRFSNGTRFALHLASHRPPQAPATVEVSFEVEDVDAAVEQVRAAGGRGDDRDARAVGLAGDGGGPGRVRGWVVRSGSAAQAKLRRASPGPAG